MHTGARQATVHGVTESDRTERLLLSLSDNVYGRKITVLKKAKPK